MSSYCGVRPFNTVVNSSCSLASTEGWSDSRYQVQVKACAVVSWPAIKIVTTSSRTSFAVILAPVSTSRQPRVARGDPFACCLVHELAHLLIDLLCCRIHQKQRPR